MTDTTDPTTLPQFPVGQRTITAAVTNSGGVAVPDILSWTASAGTVTPAADTLSATLDNAPVGDVTVTVTDAAGITASAEFEVVDETPANITLAVS